MFKIETFLANVHQEKNIQFTIVIMVSRHQRTIYQGYSPSLALFLVTSRPRLTDQWFEIICVPDPIKIHIWATLWQCLKLQELGPKKYSFPIYLVFWWSTDHNKSLQTTPSPSHKGGMERAATMIRNLESILSAKS